MKNNLDGGLIRGRGRRKEAYTGKTDVNDLVSRIAPKVSYSHNAARIPVDAWLSNWRRVCV